MTASLIELVVTGILSVVVLKILFGFTAVGSVRGEEETGVVVGSNVTGMLLVSLIIVITLVTAEWLVIKFPYGRFLIPSPNTRAELLLPLEQVVEMCPFLMLEGFQYMLLK